MGTNGDAIKRGHMRLVDLGEINAPLWLFGGAYSNLQAVEALVEAANAAGARLIGTGDMVGYGADPVAVLERLSGRADMIAGNVERQLGAGARDCGCGFATGSACETLSRGWYAHADASIGTKWRAWMRALPDMVTFRHHGRRYGVLHGGVHNISRFLWPSSPAADFRSEIAALTATLGPVDAIIAGHCGLAFERVIDGVHWINAGVIGMPPHDGRAQTRYATLGPDGACLHRLSYDHAGAARAMRAAGLGPQYADALQSGFWPSQEVLPEALRRSDAARHPGAKA